MKTWIMNNGEPISVAQMSDSHIQNCINCLEGKRKSEMNHLSKEQKKEWVIIFKNEQNSRIADRYSVF